MLTLIWPWPTYPSPLRDAAHFADLETHGGVKAIIVHFEHICEAHDTLIQDERQTRLLANLKLYREALEYWSSGTHQENAVSASEDVHRGSP